MTTYDSLRKIIPPDQALANKALARALGQVKDIQDATLPDFAAAVTVLESNKDLDLINALESPLSQSVINYWTTTFATGTGPGNTITINDMLGTAAGATMTVALPQVTSTLQDLSDLGALDPLTGNGGSSSSTDNGIYTLMQYSLTGVYSNAGNVADTTVIPSTDYYPGGSFASVDSAFSSSLIACANFWISNIAADYSSYAVTANDAFDAMADQLTINVTNCQAAGLDIGNIVNDISNANLVSNDASSTLSLVTSLHDIGLDVTEGGSAQWFESVANTGTVTGQAVIASMREGRNIAVLSAVGINLDTQLPDVNPNPVLANNLGNAQYSVSQVQANIQY